MIIYNQIMVRQGNSIEWSYVNPILEVGEPGYETDTGKLKIGNGIDNWNNLKYLTDGLDVELKSYIDQELSHITTKNGMNIQTGVEINVPSIYSFTEEDGVQIDESLPLDRNRLDYENFDGAWYQVTFQEPFESIPMIHWVIIGQYQQTFGANLSGIVTINNVTKTGFKMKHRSGRYIEIDGIKVQQSLIDISWMAIGK